MPRKRKKATGTINGNKINRTGNGHRQVMQYEVKYFSGEKVVHANGVFQPGDVALCGADLMGDSHLGWVAAVETNKKINCSACIQIIKACKNIPATQIGVPKLIEYR